MNARGSTEVIVATIGLSMGALSQNLFTMIVAMAVVTTMIMPPMLRWGLARVPITKGEKERLEREEFEAKGFLPNIERVLLAADESPNGKFASRLAGLIVGRRGMPTTIVPLNSEQSRRSRTKVADSTAVTATELVKAAVAETTNTDEQAEKDNPPAPVDVIVPKPDKTIGETIAAEATKGYDVLFVGVNNPKTKAGGFQQELSGVAGAFDGPLAIAIARDKHLKDPQACPLNILVPVAGTDVSRSAAEIAIEIGRICKASVTALYVTNKAALRSGQRRSRRQEQAILKEIVELADRNEFEIDTALAADLVPDRAILTAARRGRHDLIVMGVTRRAGEILDFGDTAAAVLNHAEASILFVSD
jgi:nucleotide-binding universal stress UspA family protein